MLNLSAFHQKASARAALVAGLAIITFLVALATLSSWSTQTTPQTFNCTTDSLSYEMGADGSFELPTLHIYCQKGRRARFVPSNSFHMPVDPRLNELVKGKTVTAYYHKNRRTIDSLHISEQ